MQEKELSSIKMPMQSRNTDDNSNLTNLGDAAHNIGIGEDAEN